MKIANEMYNYDLCARFRAFVFRQATLSYRILDWLSADRGECQLSAFAYLLIIFLDCY
jgi:hypothetical protein